MELTELKLQFIIDGHIGSNVYSIQDIIDKSIDEEKILEDMELCDCSLNESNNHCEGGCIKFDNSEITGVIIV